MKRLYTLFLLAISVIASNAQQTHKVSTAEEKKGILLEEFTGVNCSFCPEGHIIANQLYNGLKGQVHIVNLHAGPFSPKGGDRDLTTAEGDSLAYYFVPTSYPCAMINRHAFQEPSVLYQRDGWQVMSKRIKDDIAEVNLHLESKYDDSNRQLTINVEGYNVVDNSEADLRLNVLITQDYMKASQAGVADAANYTHMHVLRDYLTSYKGDAITSKNKGDYFTADFTYTLPENINEKLLEAKNINVVAFVTSKGMTEVVNVKSGKPEYVNLNVEPGAELQEPNLKVGSIYGFQFFEGKIRNLGVDRITKATFGITINNEYQEVTADCDIAPFEVNDVKVPCSYQFDEKGNVTYEVKLISINDKNITPSSFSGSFSKPVATGKNIKIEISTDRSADEDTYLLKDEDGNVLKEFGPYPTKKVAKYEESVVLEEEKTYCIEVYDAFGNGITTGKKGWLITYDSEGKEIDNFNPITEFGARSFFTVNESLAIENITVSNKNNGKIFSITGRVLNDNDKTERIIIKNGKKYINK